MGKPLATSRSIINQFRRHYLIASIIPVIFLLILIVIGTVLTRNYLSDLLTKSTYDLNHDAESSLQQLGEEIIMTKARDVAKQIEMYFRIHPGKTFSEMRKDPLFMGLAIQRVGKTGYTALTEVNTWLFLVHPNAKLNDTDMRPLAKKMPDWWKIIAKAVATESTNSGYYMWREPDGSFRKKFMVVTPIAVKHRGITIWVSATTYIDEFSLPVLQMQHKADMLVSSYQKYVLRQMIWFSLLAGLIILLVFLGTFIWGRQSGLRYIMPITKLAETAKKLGEGNWDVQLPDRVLQRADEIGVMAQSFSLMSGQIKEAFASLEQRVTELRQTRDALRESEEKFSRIFRTSPDIVTITRLSDSVYVDVNDEYTRQMGYTREETIGKSALEQGIWVNLADRRSMVENLQARGETQKDEYHFRCKDGRVITVEMSARVMTIDGDLCVLSMIRNITEKIELQKAIRESEGKYRLLAEQSLLGMHIIQDGLVKYANQATSEITGYSREEMLAWEQNAFTVVLHPDDMPFIMEQARKKQSGDPDILIRYEWRIIPKSGVVKWVESFSKTIVYEGRPADFVMMIDITDRKESKEKQKTLEERLNRAEKMEALGQLAGGVAHDLNNVLGILSGYSELLLLEIPEGQRARKHAEKILQSTEKGAAIIQDLLTLARRGVTAAEVVNLNSIVAGFLKSPVFEKMKDFHPRVTLRAECQEELLNIKGSSVHLEKTLMNLVANAAEAISGKGEVTIRIDNRYLDEPISGYDDVKEGDYAILSVSDTGTGIPAEHIEKIFEPFYTKKTMGRSGTGLGLAIVWGTVKDHQGYIDVQTEVGKGTTFTLYFPVTRQELSVPLEKIPVGQYTGRGESVLVIDDIAEQREVASRLLTGLGYNVRVVAGGEEAVEYLKGNKADILVLDMIMAPGIDGLETYQRIIKINPRQKAVLVSGFSETDRVREAQQLGAGAYVKKPYVLEKIGLAIRNELGR